MQDVDTADPALIDEMLEFLEARATVDKEDAEKEKRKQDRDKRIAERARRGGRRGRR